MDSKIYIWLFNNINKYEFDGYEANQIKSAISRMLITEDSIKSETIVSKMQGLYLRFCELFYNNVLGYQYGLSNNSITASELDCYFIRTSDGLVPIGYYRIVRPAEAASMVQLYLDQCKKDMGSERSQLVAKWQTNIDFILPKYEMIKDSKNPSMIRAIIGALLVVVIVAFSVFSLIKLNFMGVLLDWGNAETMQRALKNVPLISHGTQYAWIGYLIFIVLAVAAAVIGTIYIIKEFKLISDKCVTKNILTTILTYVNKFEQGVFNSIENSSIMLYEAARRGENRKIEKNANSVIATSAEKKIRIAKEFTEKTEKQRMGIGYVLLVLLMMVVILFSLSYSQKIADSIVNMGTNKTQNVNKQQTSTDSKNTQKNPQTPVTTEKPKVSSYTVYKKDATWTEANQDAHKQGGYLVCINDKKEFDKVCQMADEKHIYVFWIGAKRNAYDNWQETKWLDGKDIVYTNWLSGEPTYFDEDGYDENYLMAFKVNGTWYFNDATNDVSKYYHGKIGYIVEVEE